MYAVDTLVHTYTVAVIMYTDNVLYIVLDMKWIPWNACWKKVVIVLYQTMDISIVVLLIPLWKSDIFMKSSMNILPIATEGIHNYSSNCTVEYDHSEDHILRLLGADGRKCVRMRNQIIF